MQHDRGKAGVGRPPAATVAAALHCHIPALLKGAVFANTAGYVSAREAEHTLSPANERQMVSGPVQYEAGERSKQSGPVSEEKSSQEGRSVSVAHMSHGRIQSSTLQH